MSILIELLGTYTRYIVNLLSVYLDTFTTPIISHVVIEVLDYKRTYFLLIIFILAFSLDIIVLAFTPI